MNISRTKQTVLTFAAAISLVGAVVVASGAQGLWRGSLFIPESSVEKPQDVGIAAHTNHLIMTTPMYGLGPGQGMTPAQVRAFYNMPAAGGSGIIAVVDAYDFPTSLSNFNSFSSQFGLPKETSTNPAASTNKVFQVVYEGGKKPAQNVSWNQEEALDIEWTHAMAPNAKIVLVEAHSSSLSDLYASIDQAAAIAGVKQISMSWGGSETPGEIALDAHFDVSGPTFLAASGDNGGTVTYPAVSPYVVAVGGTSVATSRIGVFESETGWSDGGGGTSRYEPKPAWQAGIANTGARRSIPDISAIADPNTGLAVYGPTGNWWGAQYAWMTVGGTSASTACMAGMFNVSGHASSSTSILLEHIYSLLKSKDFRDITSGYSGFHCLVGWDFVTGGWVLWLGTAGL